ncbi:MAG: FxsA family protein [Acidimicrobiia bacterium]
MLLIVLVVVLVVVPLTELYVIVQVGEAIGYLPTFALLIAISILGAYLVKRAGLSTLRRAQAQLRAGEIPAAELVDGAVIAAAGALLLTPGFVTDAIGFLLLLPPLRFLPRRWARNHHTVRAGNAVYGRVIDVRGTAGPRASRPDDPPAIPPPATGPPESR